MYSEKTLVHRRTAFSYGASSRAKDVAFKETNPIVGSLPDQDFQRAITVSFDTFLVGIGVNNDLLTSRNDPEICSVQDKIKDSDLCTKCTESLQMGETSRYQLFCNLANKILDLLYTKNKLKQITFLVNDPKELPGPFGSRQKPDIVVIPTNESGLDGSIRIDPDNSYEASWIRILCVGEFRSDGGGSSALDTDTLAAASTPATGDKGGEHGEKREGEQEGGKGEGNEASDDAGSQQATPTGAAKKSIKYKDYRIQVTRYAVNQLSFVFNRSHCILALIVRDKIIMSYYDHGGIVQSVELSFTADLYKFIILIKTLAGLDAHGLGFIKGSRLFAKSDVEDFADSVLRKDNTSSYEAQGHSVERTFQRLKHNRAREEAKGHLRGQTFVLETEGHSILVHESLVSRPLPILLLDQDFEKLSGQTPFRARAGITENFEENRIWNTILLNKLDTHLFLLKDEKVFRRCFREVFEAHYWVATEAKILHRDISIFNLMVRKYADGSMKGVLIDWDLAEDKDDLTSEPHTGTRTGTLPFTAHDLHSENPPRRHHLRFDWESFLYVLLWTVFVTLGDEEKEKAMKEAIARAGNAGLPVGDIGGLMKAWHCQSDLLLFSQKSGVLSTSAWKSYTMSPCRFSSTFRAWIFPMWELFVNAYDTRKNRKTGWEQDTGSGLIPTIDEILTYEKLSSILDKEPN